jgi:hypothetical protein
MSANQRAASIYADRLGWAVFPLAIKSKIPAIAGGRGCLDATTNAEQIARWWHGREWNVGVATGAPSGFFVVDVDPRSGGDVALEQLEAEHGAFPETVEGLTGGGGRHLLFRMHDAYAATKWSPLAPGVDLKGTGGYCVFPPSTHPNGLPYAWEASRRPLETPIADPPAWLHELLSEAPTRRREIKDADVDALDESILAQLFAAVDWLGPVVKAGARAVRCPSESLHTTGEVYDSSTVLFAPQRGHQYGWFYCSHEHCRELYRSPDAVVRALERATGRRLLVSRQVGAEG